MLFLFNGLLIFYLPIQGNKKLHNEYYCDYEKLNNKETQQQPKSANEI